MIHIRIKWVVIMWCKVKSYKVIGINLEQVWQVWSDVTNWHIWQKDIKSATIDGLFITGSQIKLKLQDDSIITMSLTEVKPYERFMDLTKFFFHSNVSFTESSGMISAVVSFPSSGISSWVSFG